MISNVFLDKERILFPHPVNRSTNEISKAIEYVLSLPTNEFYLTQNGKRLNSDIKPSQKAPIRIILRAIGGKGGFGSMLRAIGAQIEKTTNREACRDLSGRRLRDINEEKQLRTWLEKQKEREEEAAARKAKKIQKLQAKPKHEFQDEEYFSTRSNLEQTVSDALEEGLKNAVQSKGSGSGSDASNDGAAAINTVEPSGSGVKRKQPIKVVSNGKTKNKNKKKKPQIKGALWIDDDLSSDSDSDSSDSDSDISSDDAKKKLKKK